MNHSRHLRYIDEIARAGSIRRAADRLHVTSSALNRRLLDMEAELGVQLFERLPRGVRLTAAGEIVVGHIRRTLSDLERARSLIDDLRGLRRGTIRIAAIEALAHRMLPQSIAAFLRGHPLVTFKVQILGREEVVEAVLGYEADIGILFNPVALPAFQTLFEREQVLHAIVAHDHPLAGRDQLRIQDCLEYPLALADATLGGRLLLNEFLEQRGMRVSPVLEANSFEMMREFAKLAGGVCFQIGIGVTSGRAENGLIAIPVVERGFPRRNLVVGMLRDRVLPVASAMFCEDLRSRMLSA